jgi:hypothetical protein
MRSTIGMAFFCSLAACSLSRPQPTEVAARVQPRCVDVSPSAASKVAAPSNVTSVRPLYSVLDSAPNGPESRLVGAKLELRPIDGVTPEAVGLALQCHEARETTLDPPVSDSCPYAIRGMWVDIDVTSNGAGYEVALRGQDHDEAHLILQRATAFASMR